MTGSLEAIWLKPVRRGRMQPRESATLVENRGIVGNANQNGRRQVTIISRERWHEVQASLDANADPSLRRANLMISGIDLANTRGQLLKIGDTVIEIWGETKPCRTMDDQLDGLQAALRPHWGGGVFGTVLSGGTIKLGDPVELLAAPPTAPYQNWKAKRAQQLELPTTPAD